MFNQDFSDQFFSFPITHIIIPCNQCSMKCALGNTGPECSPLPHLLLPHPSRIYSVISLRTLPILPTQNKLFLSSMLLKDLVKSFYLVIFLFNSQECNCKHSVRKEREREREIQCAGTCALPPSIRRCAK